MLARAVQTTPRPRPAAIALACALSAAAAGASEPPGLPPFSFAVEGAVAKPASSAQRGYGLGLQLGVGLGDQIGLTAEAARFASNAGPFALAGIGGIALLDATPVAPYLELSLVALWPRGVTGTGLASRAGAGVQVRLARGLALGLAAHALAPLDASGGRSPAPGFEIGLRAVFTPAIFR